MEAGRLRHVVQIQDYTLAQNTNGDDIKSYSIFATVHAEIKTLRGRELFAAQQQFSEADVEISMRYLPGVRETMRIYHAVDATYFEILNVNDVMRRHVDMVLTCRTGVSEDR